MKQDSLNGLVALNEYEMIAVNGGGGQYDNSSYKPPENHTPARPMAGYVIFYGENLENEKNYHSGNI